jgi:poly-beta-1,6-N-acetyl-D-glucosamine synthase
VPIVLFALGAAFVIYVLFGYPLLLAIRSRRGHRPVRKELEWRTVSVVLPVRNGERWIRQKLQSILALNYPHDLIEILVISDGSTDRTDEIVREYALDGGVRLIRIANSGKAVAINKAIGQARGEILFFTDVRQSLDTSSLRHLVACFGDPEVGAASGELIIRTGDTHEEANLGLYWRYEKWIRKHLSRIDSVPGATGCIWAMRANLAGPLPPDCLVDDVHMPLRAFFRGYRVILDPEAKAFDYPTQLEAEFRRKVRTQAGVYQVIGAYPELLGPANRMWVHFVSHKLGRLLLPWALLAVAVFSFFLPRPWGLFALAGQGSFYGLALLDLALPERSPLKRLTSPVRTFVVLMAAAMWAVSILFIPRRQLWKETRVRSTRQAP